MSATFDISEYPVQVYLGDQSQVSLVNEGPFTIYFDESPSVDSINGFELPPTGQMTWKGNKPLFARVATFRASAVPNGFIADARLKTTISGELSLTTRARFYRPLFVGPDFPQIGSGRVMAETGHCASLSIVYTFSSGDAASLPFVLSLQLLWFDDSFTLITSDVYSARIAIQGAATGSTPPNTTTPTWRIHAPVKGKYCVIVPNFTPPTSMTMRIIGTDAILPSKCDAGVSFSGGAVPTTFSNNGRTITFTWNGTGTITIPGTGSKLMIYINSPGPASELLIVDTATARRVASLPIPTVANTRAIFDLPINTNYDLSVAAGINADFTLAWPSDTVNA